MGYTPEHFELIFATVPKVVKITRGFRRRRFDELPDNPDDGIAVKVGKLDAPYCWRCGEDDNGQVKPDGPIAIWVEMIPEEAGPAAWCKGCFPTVQQERIAGIPRLAEFGPIRNVRTGQIVNE